jgi:hypothetical protein
VTEISRRNAKNNRLWERYRFSTTSEVNSTISARQTCFCGALRS